MFIAVRQYAFKHTHKYTLNIVHEQKLYNNNCLFSVFRTNYLKLHIFTITYLYFSNSYNTIIKCIINYEIYTILSTYVCIIFMYL